jgi:hypothetical protein
MDVPQATLFAVIYGLISCNILFFFTINIPRVPTTSLPAYTSNNMFCTFLPMAGQFGLFIGVCLLLISQTEHILSINFVTYVVLGLLVLMCLFSGWACHTCFFCNDNGAFRSVWKTEKGRTIAKLNLPVAGIQ